MTAWKATAYVMRHRGALLRVVMYTPRWWQFKCDGVECATQYGSAKSAMRAAEKYVDEMKGSAKAAKKSVATPNYGSMASEHEESRYDGPAGRMERMTTTKDAAVIALLDSGEVWEHEFVAAAPDDFAIVIGTGEGKHVADMTSSAAPRHRIAACAPEALRTVIDLQWGKTQECPECESGPKQGHSEVCSIGALLRKAGVR